MLRTGRGMDGQADGRTDSVIIICLLKFFWGHKNVYTHGTCNFPGITRRHICAKFVLTNLNIQ